MQENHAREHGEALPNSEISPTYLAASDQGLGIDY